MSVSLSRVSPHEKLEIRIRALEDTLAKVLVRLARLEQKASTSQIEAETIQLPPSEVKDGPYVYRDLDGKTNEIRILVVYSSTKEEDDIICELVHASLDWDGEGAEGKEMVVAGEALTTFNTLSYTWGNVEKKGSVIIEGYRFPVTENLESGLRRLRSFNTASKSSSAITRSFWWIDAICINQEDVLERNQQVNLMTRIYKKAVGVHIWLGEQADNSEVAFQVARLLANQIPRGPGQPDIVYPKTTARQRDIHRTAIAKLCARPWWERVWVRQEVAVANEATVHCGNESCSFHALTLTLEILNRMDEELGFKVAQDEPASDSNSNIIRTTAYNKAYILTRYRLNVGRQSKSDYEDLWTLILRTRECQATDPRDKVFSVLGLADPYYWGLKADYRLSITETFMAGARCLISKKQSLDVLSGCQNPKRRNGLPSWVPNLVDGWKARPFAIKSHLFEVMAGEPPDFTFEGKGGCVLRARGFLLDGIDTLSAETPRQDATAEELDVLLTKWREIALRALSHPRLDVYNKEYIQSYNNDARWVEFLSQNADEGRPLPKAALQLKIPGDYEMAKSLLLPGEEEGGGADVKSVKHRLHEFLRKTGVGRRLCVNEAMGFVVLVPAESEVGDEIWFFRGTGYPYVLRKEEQEGYVVVGEAYCDRYVHSLYDVLKKGEYSETISIV